MLTITIPGAGTLNLNHLVLDYNGTLAEDGEIIPGIEERLEHLANTLTIHIITADTHGTVQGKTAHLPVQLKIIQEGSQDRQKERFVTELGAETVAAMGNGRNDTRMLSIAALGVGLMQTEGCAASILQTADMLCKNICDALDLLIFPNRVRASLRN